MKLSVNPAYIEKTGLIASIAEGKMRGESLHSNRRNEVELVRNDDEMWVVKRYHSPNILSRIYYTLTGRSKPRKAYENALFLQESGFRTAVPIAWGEKRINGLYSGGIFLSEFVKGGLVVQIYEPEIDPEFKRELCGAIALFTARIHKAGIQPLDYNPGNLFFEKDHEGYKFTLIDINRLAKGKIPTPAEGMRAMSQLGLREEEFPLVLTPYCREMGFEEEMCRGLLLEHRRRYHRRHKRNA